jgi:hypothetical protein
MSNEELIEAIENEIFKVVYTADGKPRMCFTDGTTIEKKFRIIRDAAIRISEVVA